jgi:hypothetical protein
MYIRRKVYSVFEDENGELRYFSTNEIVSEEDYLERLYSEDYLDDDDMERLFSDFEDERYYARAVETEAVKKGKELGQKNAKKIKELQETFKKELEEMRRKGGGGLQKRLDALKADQAKRMEALKASFKDGSHGNATVKKLKEETDKKLVGKSSYKAMERTANLKRPIYGVNSKISKFYKTKGGKAAILGTAGLGIAGAAGYGGYRLAHGKSEK